MDMGYALLLALFISISLYCLFKKSIYFDKIAGLIVTLNALLISSSSNYVGPKDMSYYFTLGVILLIGYFLGVRIVRIKWKQQKLIKEEKLKKK